MGRASYGQELSNHIKALSRGVRELGGLLGPECSLSEALSESIQSGVSPEVLAALAGVVMMLDEKLGTKSEGRKALCESMITTAGQLSRAQELVGQQVGAVLMDAIDGGSSAVRKAAC